jgi:hypothetical protein
VDLVHHYHDAADLVAANNGGYEWIGALIHTAGLPIEILHIVCDRVSQIDAFDYEEGHVRPLTWQAWHWFEAMEPPFPEPYTVQLATIAVLPNGTWVTLAGT